MIRLRNEGYPTQNNLCNAKVGGGIKLERFYRHVLLFFGLNLWELDWLVQTSNDLKTVVSTKKKYFCLS